MTDVAFPGLTQGEDIFKSIIWDNAVQAALALLYTQAPYLALPVIKQVITFIITSITNKVFSAIRLFIDLEAIQIVNAEKKAAYDKAAVTLKIIAHDKGIDSPEFKRAKENAKEALSKFVSFGAA